MFKELSRLMAGIVNFVFGLAVLGLSLRFLLRLFGASPEAGFVRFIYDSTAPLLYPFRGIFQPYVIDPGNVLEFSTLFAIVIYILLAWLLVEFIVFITYQSRTYRK